MGIEMYILAFLVIATGYPMTIRSGPKGHRGRGDQEVTAPKPGLGGYFL